MATAIPADWRQRAPLMTERAWQGLGRWLQHADAPRYNRVIGDRVGMAELEGLAAFRRDLAERALEAGRDPSAAMAAWVEALRPRLYALAELPRGFDVARDFTELPTTSRDDIVRRLDELVPHDADLASAVVYSTSGTTGHPVIVPSHPAAMVRNLAHLERVATLHGVTLTPQEGEPFALNVSHQKRTYLFATTVAGWSGAVFAKINLAAHDWAGGAAARGRFTAEFAPAFVASDPRALAELARLEIGIRPRLVVSSAVSLGAAHAARLGAAFGAAVVDLYSSTETGPIAATLPGAGAQVVLLPDVYLEALDGAGERVPDGARGEITVTGGRNPYLPLVRYRTGDYGRLGTVTLPDGRSARAIFELEGRPDVIFRAAGGEPVTSVDVARAIRPLCPYVQHALVQRADGSVDLALLPVAGVPIAQDALEHALRELFGRDARITVRVDFELGKHGKVIAWRNELSSGAEAPP